MYAFQFHSKVRGGRERQFIIIVLENTFQSYHILHRLAQYAIFDQVTVVLDHWFLHVLKLFL